MRKEVFLGNTHVVSPQRTLCWFFVCNFLLLSVPPKQKKEMLSCTTPNFQTPTSTQQSPYVQTHPTQAQPSSPTLPASPHPHPLPTATPQQPHAPPSNYSSPPQPASFPPAPVPYSQTTQQRPPQPQPPQQHAQPHSPHHAQRSAQGATPAEQAAAPEDPYRAAKQRTPALRARVYASHLRTRAAWRFATSSARRIGLRRGGGRCVIVRVGRCVGAPGAVVLCVVRGVC
jgi:outer membrane biosynthesis protein TonB